MVRKPITVARNDYMNALCEITNRSGLPAFVIADVLDKLLNEVKARADIELKNDMARYQTEIKADQGDNTDEQRGVEMNADT